MSRKNEKSLNDSLNEHAKRLREQEAAAAPTESEQVVAAPAEDAQIEAPASQGEALTAAQEKALAALQKCLVAIQNKLRSAYAEVKKVQDGTRRARHLELFIQRMAAPSLNSILEKERLVIPDRSGEDYTYVFGFNLPFIGVGESWNEAKNVLTADIQAQYPELTGRKLKKLQDDNLNVYKQMLLVAVRNTFINPQTPDLAATFKASRIEEPVETTTESGDVEKATGAAEGIKEKRKGLLRRTFEFAAKNPLLIQIFIWTGITLATGAIPLMSVLYSTALAPFVSRGIRYLLERAGANPQSLFGLITLILLSATASILTGAALSETAHAVIPKEVEDATKFVNNFAKPYIEAGQAGVSAASSGATELGNQAVGLWQGAEQRFAEAATEASTPPDMSILSDPDFDPGDKVTLRDTKLTFLIGPNGETSLVDYDPNAPTKSADEFNNFKDAVHYRDSTAPPAPTIVQERIPMEMPPRADAPVVPEATTGTAETSAQPAPAPAEAPAQPTATGAETVTPPAEIGPVFAGGDEGMVSILDRLREQVQQAAAQDATFPEGSLADQLLKADSQADLIKIAQDNGWFNTVADTAGTPDSVVIYENDKFAINNDGELVAPKDFESRGMTDTGDYTPKGTVQRS